MSLYRVLWILARTPLVLPEAAKQAAAGIPLTTFREYTTPKTLPTIPSSTSAGEALSNSNGGTRSLGGPGAHTQTSPAGPDVSLASVFGSLYTFLRPFTNPISHYVFRHQADEVAHAEEAYEGSQSDPETSKSRLERQVRQNSACTFTARNQDFHLVIYRLDSQ